MVELKLGPRTVDLPYSVRLYGVTEEKFDELVNEDLKADLLDGEMIVHSPASPRHDDVSGFLRTLMRFYADERKLGKVFGPDSLVHLATCRQFGPDIFFLVPEQVSRPLPRKRFEGAPALVVEVLSSSTREYDLDDKRQAFRDAGVKELWFVDPDGDEVVVDRRRGRTYTTRTVGKGRIASTVLTGFWVDAAWLWSDPSPSVVDCLHKILK